MVAWIIKLAWVIFFFSFPALILFLSNKIKLLSKINPVILAYVFGFVFALAKVFPDYVGSLQKIISQITVVFAIPLLLFPMDLKLVWRLSKKTIIAMIIGIIALFIVLIVGTYYFGNLFKGQGIDFAKISGLLVGLYTGGTPNLASLKAALNVDNETYLAVHTADTLIGIFYFCFI